MSVMGIEKWMIRNRQFRRRRIHGPDQATAANRETAGTQILFSCVVCVCLTSHFKCKIALN